MTTASLPNVCWLTTMQDTICSQGFRTRYHSKHVSIGIVPQQKHGKSTTQAPQHPTTHWWSKDEILVQIIIFSRILSSMVVGCLVFLAMHFTVPM